MEEYIQFEGLFKRIKESYSVNFNLDAFIEKELGVDSRKAKAIAARIRSTYDFEKAIRKELNIKKIRDAATTETESCCAIENTVSRNRISALDSLSGVKFEEFLEFLFIHSGYCVEKTPHTGDWGVDLVITKDNERIAVQAKRYRAGLKVSNEPVLKLDSGKKHYKCDKAMIVTTSEFTRAAKEAAHENGIELWDRGVLSSKIDKINESMAKKETSNLPSFKGNLLDSLMQFKKTEQFYLKNKDEKYDLFMHGIKSPLISFKVHDNTIFRLAFRFKGTKPIPEYGPESNPMIESSRAGTNGPPDDVAYTEIKQYLALFIK